MHLNIPTRLWIWIWLWSAYLLQKFLGLSNFIPWMNELWNLIQEITFWSVVIGVNVYCVWPEGKHESEEH